MSGEPPTFLARRGYRGRRLEDAARALPFIGALLLLLPLLWQPEGAASATLPAAIYLFVVWTGLLIVAAIVAAALNRKAEVADSDGTEDPS